MPVAKGLQRPRLVAPLAGEAALPLAVVVGPAGSGKSTLLTHVAHACGTPVAWFALDSDTTEVPAVLAHLRAALDDVAPDLPSGWQSPAEALADLEEHLAADVLLVLDDVHSLDAQPGADVLRQLVRHQPRRLRLLLGSRTVPDVDLPRCQVAGMATTVDADSLRFRTWEVEELFRRCHGVPLRAAEVSALTQRTGGWAAGLQLFHLATHHRPPSTRTALLEGGGSTGQLTREYLTAPALL